MQKMKEVMKITGLVLTILILLPCYTARAAVYTDDMGAEVYLKNTPLRIVSLSPAITEILYALELDERIVGVTKFSDYPPQARNKPQVGSYVKLNLEKIISLQPDLVLSTAEGNPKEAVDRLRELRLAVFAINPHSFDDIFKSILQIGRLTGKLTEAEKIVVRMKQRRDRVKELTATQAKVRVFVQIEPAPLVTVAKNTFWDQLISLAGGENIAHDEPMRYPRYSIEAVVVRNPEVIIVTSMLHLDDQAIAQSTWAKWKSVPAVRDKRIYTINPSLGDRPGPRIIEGLEELARLLHPEVFQ